jgi:hypothetical protein
LVREEDVEKIISGIDADVFSRNGMDGVIASYKELYWDENPEEGEAIARRLLAAGKVDAPRTKSGDMHTLTEGYWIDADGAEDKYKERLLDEKYKHSAEDNDSDAKRAINFD